MASGMRLNGADLRDVDASETGRRPLLAVKAEPLTLPFFEPCTDKKRLQESRKEERTRQVKTLETDSFVKKELAKGLHTHTQVSAHASERVMSVPTPIGGHVALRALGLVLGLRARSKVRARFEVGARLWVRARFELGLRVSAGERRDRLAHRNRRQRQHARSTARGGSDFAMRAVAVHW
eukprot:6176398-Pleurochrysis_carterae.AAC.1